MTRSCCEGEATEGEGGEEECLKSDEAEERRGERLSSTKTEAIWLYYYGRSICEWPQVRRKASEVRRWKMIG